MNGGAGIACDVARPDVHKGDVDFGVVCNAARFGADELFFLQLAPGVDYGPGSNSYFFGCRFYAFSACTAALTTDAAVVTVESVCEWRQIVVGHVGDHGEIRFFFAADFLLIVVDVDHFSPGSPVLSRRSGANRPGFSPVGPGVGLARR